jgi:hypothetical protein
MQVSWELSSPYLGSVLHKLLPRDTYTLYKSGTRVRIDGHLKGMREDATTFLPEWKYGSFSIIADTSNACSMKPLYISHDKRYYTFLEVRWVSNGCRVTCHVLSKHVSKWATMVQVT